MLLILIIYNQLEPVLLFEIIYMRAFRSVCFAFGKRLCNFVAIIKKVILNLGRTSFTMERHELFGSLASALIRIHRHCAIFHCCHSLPPGRNGTFFMILFAEILYFLPKLFIFCQNYLLFASKHRIAFCRFGVLRVGSGD